MMDAFLCNVLISLVLFTFLIAVAVKIQDDGELHEHRYAEEITIRKRAVDTTATETCTSVNVVKTDPKPLSDKRLIGHELFKVSVEKKLECVQWCLSHSACQSYSFYQQNKQCTLHDVNSTSVNAAELESLTGSIFQDISGWTGSQTAKSLLGACASRPCSVAQRCFPNLQDFMCINIDCAILPKVPHTTRNTSKTLYGTVIYHVCIKGYVMIGSAFVRCMANAQWSIIPNCKRGKQFYCGETVDYTQFDLYNEGFGINVRTSITFQIRGIQNARILLQFNSTNYVQGVEILLGGDNHTNSMIRTTVDDPSTAVSTYTHGTIYDNVSFRPFWISWKNGCVQVGRGIMNSNNIIGSTVQFLSPTTVIMNWCGLTSSIVNMRISFGQGYDGFFNICQYNLGHVTGKSSFGQLTSSIETTS